jgi:hypothetical protein
MHWIPKAFAALLRWEGKYLREGKQTISQPEGAVRAYRQQQNAGWARYFICAWRVTRFAGRFQNSLARADPVRMLGPNRKVVHSLVP